MDDIHDDNDVDHRDNMDAYSNAVADGKQQVCDSSQHCRKLPTQTET